MITTDVVPGVHQVTLASTNLFLLDAGDGVTVVDAGLPGMWDETTAALQTIGRGWSDVRAFVLTHAHFDHVGILARATAEHDIPVWVHPGDLRIVRHPYRYRPGRARLLYPVRHPRSVPHLTAMVRAGALSVRGVEGAQPMSDGDVLDVPGRLRVIATPGHTNGHCALHALDHDVVFSGDGLVTLDPYTGRTGPRVVARAGTYHATAALRSLELVAATGAGTVAPGHGAAWSGGAAAAAGLARQAGVA